MRSVAGEERSRYGRSVSVSRKASADDSMPGWLLGAEADQESSDGSVGGLSEVFRLERPGRSRGVAGTPAEWGAPHAVGAGGKTFPTANNSIVAAVEE